MKSSPTLNSETKPNKNENENENDEMNKKNTNYNSHSHLLLHYTENKSAIINENRVSSQYNTAN